MARCFAFFTPFHLSLTFFRPEVPFKSDFTFEIFQIFAATELNKSRILLNNLIAMVTLKII